MRSARGDCPPKNRLIRSLPDAETRRATRMGVVAPPEIAYLHQDSRVDAARAASRSSTGTVMASAPGRVNLIGEHTDYNGGFVLPVVLPRRVVVELTPRDDMHVRVRSDALGDAEYVIGEEVQGQGWVDRVQAITFVLGRDGHRIRGFQARIWSDQRDRGIALFAQRADHEFVGVRSGIMDQLVASLGKDGVPLLIDTRSLGVSEVPLPAAAELLVIDSGVAHDNLSGAYNLRRRECEEAAGRLGVASLREIDGTEWGLPDQLERRVRHVVTENARVLRTVDALRASDLEAVGTLLDASHASLRDDYEVSSPELDLLVEIARAQPAVLGARLTGAGFGGSIVAIARVGRRDTAERIAAEYATRSGKSPSVVLPV